MIFNTYRFDELTINYDRNRIPLSAMEREKRPGQYRYYGAQGVIDYVDDYIFDGLYLLIAEDGENLKSNKQNIAQIVDGKFWVNNHAHIIQTKDCCNIKYLCYLINYMDLSGYITGSAQPKLSQGNLNAIELKVPEKYVQDKIATIFSLIDERISINIKINDNLQEQAHAVFRSWFVDYTPFGGSAPSDWFPSTLGKVCSCELGGTPSRAKAEYWNGNIPWINSGEVNLFRITKPSETITELGLSKSATKLLPAKTTVIAITGATLGQISLLEIESCANQSVVGVVPNEQLPYEFIYPYIFNNIKELISHQTGGAQQHINKQNVEGLPIIVPSKTIMNDYVSLVGGYYSAIANNCFENERLAELRDILLPRLMSGELDVSNIDL